MTVLEADKPVVSTVNKEKEEILHVEQDSVEKSPDSAEASAGAEAQSENVFSDENLSNESEVEEDISLVPDGVARRIRLAPSDKVDFIDAVVHNTRFFKKYELFGGKMSLTLRSLTADEVNAMSCWIVKKGSNDSAGMLAGKYRKYLLAAQVEMLNGTKFPPLEDPLFETIAEDGKTAVKPGWENRCDYWDNISAGVFNVIMNCINDFDTRYAMLCQKADDVNFWNPDTP